MRKLLLIVLFFFVLVKLEAQSSFQKRIGFGNYLNAADMILYKDSSSFLIMAYDSTAISRNIVLMHIDTNGVILWQRKLTNPATSKFDAFRIKLTLDHGFCIAGRNFYLNGDTTIAIYKVDSIGQPIWSIEYRPTGGGLKDAATDINESPTGNLYATGYYHPTSSTQVYPWVCRLSAAGQILWFNQLNIPGGEAVRIHALQDTSIVVGVNMTGVMRKPVIVFMVSSGAITKASTLRRYGYTDIELVDMADYMGSNYHSQFLFTTLRDSVGKISAATCDTYSDGQDGFVLNDSIPNHDLRAKRCPKNYNGWCLMEMSDTTAATVCGYTQFLTPIVGEWLIDTIYSSKPACMQVFPPASMGTLHIFTLSNIPVSSGQGGIVITKAVDPFLLPAPCNSFYTNIYSFSEFWADSLFVLSGTSIPGLLLQPVLTSSMTNYQVITDCVISAVPENSIQSDFTLFPNPSSGNFQLKGNFPSKSELHVYDLLGKEVASPVVLPDGEQSVSIELNLASGVYFYGIISDGKFLHEEKLVIVK